MTALNRCTVTDSLWNYRYADCRSSWNFEEIMRPSSRRKSTADSLIGPSVSTAIGWNENEAGRSQYYYYYYYYYYNTSFRGRSMWQYTESDMMEEQHIDQAAQKKMGAILLKVWHFNTLLFLRNFISIMLVSIPYTGWPPKNKSISLAIFNTIFWKIGGGLLFWATL